LAIFHIRRNLSISQIIGLLYPKILKLHGNGK
jgi:hypothetical protein